MSRLYQKEMYLDKVLEKSIPKLHSLIPCTINTEKVCNLGNNLPSNVPSISKFSNLKYYKEYKILSLIATH